MRGLDHTSLSAQLSHMIYDDVDYAEGCELETFEVGNSYAAIISNETHAFLVFRGSDDIKDFRYDFRFIKVPWRMGGRVHRGFLKAYELIREDIWKAMTKHYEKEIIITGHSLGGAMAQLAASDLGANMVYVFGCPRVGNQDFVDTIDCDGVRYENGSDPVTHVPFRWGPIQTLWAWAHFRKATYYRQPWRTGELPGKGHGMENYLAALGIT